METAICGRLTLSPNHVFHSKPGRRGNEAAGGVIAAEQSNNRSSASVILVHQAALD